MITGTCFLTHVCGSEKTGLSTAAQEARTDSGATGSSLLPAAYLVSKFDTIIVGGTLVCHRSGL